MVTGANSMTTEIPIWSAVKENLFSANGSIVIYQGCKNSIAMEQVNSVTVMELHSCGTAWVVR